MAKISAGKDSQVSVRRARDSPGATRDHIGDVVSLGHAVIRHPEGLLLASGCLGRGSRGRAARIVHTVHDSPGYAIGADGVAGGFVG